MKLSPPRSNQWLKIGLLSVIAVLTMQLPYLLGYLTTPPGAAYTGLIMNPEDSQTYFAKLWQGTQGAWLYTIPFTPEAHDGALVGVFYVWLGQAARLLGMSATAVWHTSRILAAVILFWVTFAFIAEFVQARRTRWTAFALALFGSGLGWLLFLLGQPYWLDAFPVDFKQPGAHLFFTAMTYPHITLGTACIMISVIALRRISIGNGRSWRWLLLANLSNLLLAIAYPFLIFLVIGTAVLTWLALCWQARRVRWRLAFQFAGTSLLPAPLYIYFITVLQTNAVFRAWDAQAGTPAAPWPHYLLAFGPYLLAAALLWWKRPSARQAYLVLWAWLLTAALLLYAPLGPQRRFVQGVHAPLALVTAVAWTTIILPRLARSRPWQRLVAHPRYETPKLARLLTVLFLLGMSLSNLYLWADVTRTAALVQPDPLFRPQAEVDATEWLRENTNTGAIVLAAYQTGNYIAAHSSQRVMLGHWAETVDYDAKTALVAQFFTAATADAWRKEQLNLYHVSFVWHGPRERALGGFDPAAADYLTPVQQIEDITLYTVQLP